MPTEITCPSGLKGEARGLSVKDGRFLTDKKVARENAVIDRILSSCWMETIDAGMYRAEPKLNWDDVLIGDRDYALIKIRIESYGAEYEFKVVCEACGDRFPWELDLDDLLGKNTRTLPDSSRELFQEGNEFKAQVDGMEVTFRLPCGKHARAQLGNRKKRAPGHEPNLIVDALEMRVVSIDKMLREPEKPVSARAKREFLEGLSLGTMRKMIAEFDKADCGVDTSFEVECPNCDRIQEVDLPFDKNFFFPSLGGRL